ncbi:MAG TPA: hypothetical protein P5195_04470 [Anaerolineae bacterium]|nr:hypothetical protein [Anaerolineae bacterium]
MEHEEIWDAIARLERSLLALQRRVLDLEQRMDDAEAEIAHCMELPLLTAAQIAALPSAQGIDGAFEEE